MAVNLKPKSLPEGYTITATVGQGGRLAFDIRDADGDYIGDAKVDAADVKKEKVLEAAVAAAVEKAKEHAAKVAENQARLQRQGRQEKASQKIADKLNQG